MLALLATRTMFSQATLGSAAVSGTVRDASGSVIAGARVVLVETARNLERTTDTNDSGLFLFPTVPSGSFDVRVTKSGFKGGTLRGVAVEVGQRAVLDVTLELGEVSTVVDVSAGGITKLETESNTIGTVVDSARVEELPLNGRNFLQLALLAAGSNETPGRANAASQTGHGNRTISIAGNQGIHTGYLVNGIVARGTRSAELTLNLSVASIDQFKVQQSFFMPDQGPNPGLVNVTTKGGGNAFHGQAFEFVRNEIFDARSFFAPGPEKLHRNQFGAALGGPIKKDRVWFYGNFEIQRDITAFSARAYTPSQAMFGGDLREVLPRPIHDPQTFSAETGTRTPFAGNIIPATRINSVSKNLLKYYLPGSSLAQRPQNLSLNPRNTADEDQWGIRVDASLTSKQNLYGQFLTVDSPLVNAGLFPLTGAFYPNETQIAMMQHTYALRPNLVSTVRAGFARSLAFFSNEGKNVGSVLKEVGVTNTLDDRGITAINLQEYAGFGRANGDLGNIDNVYQLDQGTNWVKGRHNFQFGVGMRYYRTWQQNANAAALGTLGYQRSFTAQLQRDAQGRYSTVANTGDAFADFLLGIHTTGSMRGLPLIPYRFTQVTPYLQDTWKVTPGLTVNWGISWFKATVPNPQKWARDMVHGFDYSTGLLKYAALGEISPQVLEPDNNNFTPRLGFAWKPKFLRDTVIRAGAGIYYGDQALGILQWAMVAPPISDAIDINNPVTNPNPTYFLGVNTFPAIPRRPLDGNYAATVQNAAPFLFNDKSRSPYMQQWNFSIQHSLRGGDVLELVYMGNGNHNLQSRYDVNQCKLAEDLRCDNSTRQYSRYTSLLKMDFPANATYHAAIAKYDRRFSGGLAFRFEYTLAKALSDIAEGEAQFAFCRRCEKGPTSFDVRHRGVISAIYELPFGKGRRFGGSLPKAAGLALGGWTATGIATFQTGVAFPITSPNQTGSVFSDARPNRLCDGRDDSLSSNLRNNGFRQFRADCFSVPRSGFFGNTGRNPLNAPGINNFDLGIHKQFPILEAVKFQFRLEMFNAFNHAQFGQPVALSSSPAFGVVTGTRAPRLIQLGGKLLF